jgi:acetoin utilization deacetylase AcuC-like enzyme
MHELDPKATLKLPSATIERRDLQVFRTLRAAKIPLLCSLAGGYQSPEKTAALYFASAASLARVYSPLPKVLDCRSLAPSV